MSKEFYKDIKIIKYCKECGVMYRPRRGSIASSCGLCIVCRRRLFYRKYKHYMESLTPEQFELRYAYLLSKRLEWEVINPRRRRQLALESYHRCKDKPRNKARKHRRTKPLV